MLTISEWIRLIKVSKKRNKSKTSYYEFQKIQGEYLIKFILENNIKLKNKLLLDLGSGYGGYSEAFVEAEAKVISLDLYPSKHREELAVIKADGNNLPHPYGLFEIVICTSLIEHVPDPGRLLAEIRRVMKDDAILILSFPPFYSPVGGHYFAPYHLLGEKYAIQIIDKKRRSRIDESFNNIHLEDLNSYSKAFGNWGLYPLSIRKIKREINTSQLVIIKQATRYLPINLSKIPILGEFLTWHVQFILRKS